MNEAIPLRVDNLTKVFEPTSFFGGTSERFTAVNDISFELKQGEILGLLGPNGAGKTTTIHMLLGLTEPTSGTIAYFGKDIQSCRSEIMKQVTFASASMRFIGRLTVYENLSFYAQLYGIVGTDQVQQIEHYLKLFGLWDIKDRQASKLSAGENTRATLAKAFIPRPRVVLLDEPTAALDPDIAYAVRKFVLEQRDELGVSIVFTSHNMDEVSEICDRVLVMKNGSIIGRDTPASLAASVSKARVHLISKQSKEIALFAKEQGLKVTTQEHAVLIEMDEQSVASFLMQLTRKDLEYQQIAIEQPRLEDYFMEIAQRKHNG